MHSFESLCKEWDLLNMEFSHTMETAYDMCMIEINICSMMEHQTDDPHELSVYYEEATKGFIQKVIEAIGTLIKGIGDLISSIGEKMINAFSKSNAKEKLKGGHVDEELEVQDTEESKKLLDEYIREMAKLERKLLHVKSRGNIITGRNAGKTVSDITEVNLIMREMDALDKEYDPKFLKANKKIIKLASNDAIRFATKKLDNIKVDYDAVKKGSTEVLTQFKKDANGCEIPQKANLLQKMAMKISARTRQVASSSYDRDRLSITKILAVAAAGMTAKVAFTRYRRIPETRASVDEKLDKAGIPGEIVKNSLTAVDNVFKAVGI